MANNGPLGTGSNPGFIDNGTCALTHNRPPGTLCGTRPTQTQIERYAAQAAHRLEMATNWIDTRSAIGSFVGTQSFSAGVVAGMVKNLATSVYELLKLFKTLALAEYYETQHSQSFLEKFSHAMNLGGIPGLAVTGGMMMASHFWPEFDRKAREAFEEREVLIKTVAYAFEHPGEVFSHITADQKTKYESFKKHASRHTLAGDFLAGVLFGELLLDVLLIIDGVTAIARIATKIPGLLKLLPKLEELAPALRSALKRGGGAAKDAVEAPKAVSGKVYDRINPTGRPEPEAVPKPSEEIPKPAPKGKLEPGTPEHKADRWQKYQDRGGTKDYDKWSKQYDTNMRNFQHGLAREAQYREAMDATEGTLKTPLTNRQVDILKEDELYAGQLKTGPVSLTKENALAIQKDAELVKRGWTVEHILEKGASKPYLDALDKAGIDYTIGPTIPQ